jgi:DNA-binding HxlR family transcriptional regulator
VLDLINHGTNRPGAMVREIEGLTTTVLNERLNKLQRYGLLDRLVFPEKPPRVEYRFTKFGGKFLKIIDAIYELQDDIEASSS